MSEPRGVPDTHDEEMTREEIDGAMNSREYKLWQLGSILGPDHPVMVFMATEEGAELLSGLALHVYRADSIARFSAQEGIPVPFQLDPWDLPTWPPRMFERYYAARLAEEQREQEAPV